MRFALLALAACSSAPAPEPPANRAPETRAKYTIAEFGEITLDDGSLALLDRGTGDERVHFVLITRDFAATKTSWADQPGPRRDMRTASFPIDNGQRAQIRSWIDELWPLAPKGRRAYGHAPDSNYSWAIVMRKGDEVRILDGGASTPDGQPDILESVVDFLDMQF